MRMTIQYASGVRVDAVILAANRDRMRIAIPSQNDTAELHRVGGSWYTDTLQAVQIDSIIQMPGTDASDFCAAVYPRTATAGDQVESL
jgi:hypothetical protein